MGLFYFALISKVVLYFRFYSLISKYNGNSTRRIGACREGACADTQGGEVGGREEAAQRPREEAQAVQPPLRRRAARVRQEARPELQPEGLDEEQAAQLICFVRPR